MSDESTGTREAILAATRAALREHGYDELSMAKVAAEFDGSQSLIHYHFDDREGLLAAFLARRRERFEASSSELPADPDERLERLVEERIAGLDEPEAASSIEGYLGLHGAALDSEPIRRELAALDDALFEAFRETIARGVETGAFRECDPATVARVLVAGHDSAFLRVTVDDSPAAVRDALEDTLLASLREGDRQ
ncbi:TetR/AcrR family transcriptional regulator [Halobaculum sp. MBLA0143]|uniref:TetR/AcrR family transcriptional regulator n=1 Tax=Halobaculum sp. MBLA0143 TaxID=3079933 RepID=UPI0035254780